MLSPLLIFLITLSLATQLPPRRYCIIRHLRHCHYCHYDYLFTPLHDAYVYIYLIIYDASSLPPPRSPFTEFHLDD